MPRNRVLYQKTSNHVNLVLFGLGQTIRWCLHPKPRGLGFDTET